MSKTTKSIKGHKLTIAQTLTGHNLKALVRQYRLYIYVCVCVCVCARARVRETQRHSPLSICVPDSAPSPQVTMQNSYTGMVHCNNVLSVVKCTPVSYVISYTGNRLKLQLVSDFTPLSTTSGGNVTKFF